MRLLPRRLTAPLRHWRTAKGFGVHSPFAYHFITRVLRERLPYYDFDRLAEVEGPIAARYARLLYRLTDYFSPATATVSGIHAEPARRIMQMAAPAIEFTEGSGADMAVCAGSCGFTLSDVPVSVIFSTKRSEIARLTRLVTQGMTFSNGHVLIIVKRRGLPRQDFRLRF